MTEADMIPTLLLIIGMLGFYFACFTNSMRLFIFLSENIKSMYWACHICYWSSPS